MTLYILQDKSKTSFEEVVFDRLNASVQHLFDLAIDEADLSTYYSAALVACAHAFRRALRELTARHATVRVRVVYSTRGDRDGINPKVLAKGKDIVKKIEGLLPGGDAEVWYLGAKELLELSRREPTYTLTLQFVEGPISVGESYVVLSTLREYFDFITDDSGMLRKNIFEWNVRDYQGDVEVNRDIRRTLDDRDAPQFWWLNNGVTIISSKASIAGKQIALDDVQIVNGLQTSFEIFDHLSKAPTQADEDRRNLLCRIIVTADTSVRDRIIKATNFQSSVSAASLKATDTIQRDIEQYFYGQKWYYDRRKNYYKNLGRPADRIVSIPYLAQAVTAMGLGQPDFSRARPTTLIKNTDDYGRVFDQNVSIATYLWAARNMKKVEHFLRGKEAPGSESEKRELRFHLAMWVVARKLGRLPTGLEDVLELLDHDFDDKELTAAMAELMGFVAKYPDSAKSPLDVIAKQREFVRYIARSKFGDGPGPVATAYKA